MTMMMMMHPDDTGPFVGSNSMEEMLMMMESSKHQSLFSASFDTISDAGGQPPNLEDVDGTNHNSRSFFGGGGGDNTTNVLLHHNMMLESPIPLKEPAIDGPNTMVIAPRSHYHHQPPEQQEEESMFLQPQQSESREEEQEDERPNMEQNNDDVSHRSSSEDDHDDGMYGSDQQNHQPPHFQNNSPSHRVVPLRRNHHSVAAAADISPIALDVFDPYFHGRRKKTPQRTTTTKLMHATSLGTPENQPNEVSFLKSESSSTVADEHDPVPLTKHEDPTDNHQGNVDPSFHRNQYGMPPYGHESGYGHHHQQQQYQHLPPHPNAPVYHTRTIHASPVVRRRQNWPPMVRKWGIYPSQRVSHNYPPLYIAPPPPANTPDSTHDLPSFSSSAHYAHAAQSRHGEYYPNNPIYVLRTIRKAFEGCTYLLYCVRSSQMVCPVNIHQSHMGDVEYEDEQVFEMLCICSGRLGVSFVPLLLQR
jgi:hypothetical protein